MPVRDRVTGDTLADQLHGSDLDTYAVVTGVDHRVRAQIITIEGSAVGLVTVWVNAARNILDLNCGPLSEWTMQPLTGPRRATASLSASTASLAVIRSLIE